MEEALTKFMPEETTWTRPDGGMSVWVTLPPGFDAGELLIHARERGVLYVPGRHFYFQNPQPNTLRLGFASVDEAKITRGAETLGEILTHGIAQAAARRARTNGNRAWRWSDGG